jgi:hypothetical protein
MSFADLLRQSRSTTNASVHKFLTNYDPSQQRVYAFVEGDPDQAFYRSFISAFLLDGTPIYFINCEGKKRVFDAHSKVIERYPSCRNVLFFVDKDVDDLIGLSWPQDPRIFSTDCYSVENYVVCAEAAQRYLADYVKFRRVVIDLSPVPTEFTARISQFYRAIRVVMCWIIAMRRSGARVVLNDIKLEELIELNSAVITPKKGVDRLDYLKRVTQSTQTVSWREVRRCCRELANAEPKKFVRGKFEAWFLVEFIKRMIADLAKVAAEEGGGISVNAPLQVSNMIQLLVRAISIPPNLSRFLEFHLGTSAALQPQRVPSRGQKLARWIRNLFPPN